MIKTKESSTEDEVKKLAEVITESINEEIVNILVMQHPVDKLIMYMECCKRDYCDKRVPEAKDRGYALVSKQQDMYLKEGAT